VSISDNVGWGPEDGTQQLKESRHMQHDFFFSLTALAERYGVDPRTVLRWKKARKLPPPDTRTPSGRDLWGNKTIEAHERALVGITAEAAS
jgi:hypothetical protein